MAKIAVYRCQLKSADAELTPFVSNRKEPGTFGEMMDILCWGSMNVSIKDNSKWRPGLRCGVAEYYVGHWFEDDVLEDLYDAGYELVKVEIPLSTSMFVVTGQVGFEEATARVIEHMSLVDAQWLTRFLSYMPIANALEECRTRRRENKLLDDDYSCEYSELTKSENIDVEPKASSPCS